MDGATNRWWRGQGQNRPTTRGGPNEGREAGPNSPGFDDATCTGKHLIVQCNRHSVYRLLCRRRMLMRVAVTVIGLALMLVIGLQSCAAGFAGQSLKMGESYS